MNSTFLCASCGTRHSVRARTIFRDQELCPACLEGFTRICAHCGERIWTEDNVGTHETPLCEPCFERYYTICSRCGRLLRNGDACYENEEDDRSLCYSCYSTVFSSRAIHDYYYRPEPIFYGDGPRYMGVELEVDGAGEDSGNAREALSIANRTKDLLYCKHDGSLEEGFELVTHPMDLNFQQGEMPWPEILDALKNMGYRSHQAGTCGLHVHVSRLAFGETLQQQDTVIARILYFFEKFWDELLKFSRRTPRQLQHWASRYGFKDSPTELLDHAKKGNGAGRYTCVNLLNENTIEFRIFRGTLKYNTLIAALQLIDRVCDVALYLSDEEIRALSWTSFVSGCTQSELIQYLKERRLYVNEPVEGEVEL